MSFDVKPIDSGLSQSALQGQFHGLSTNYNKYPIVTFNISKDAHKAIE